LVAHGKLLADSVYSRRCDVIRAVRQLGKLDLHRDRVLRIRQVRRDLDALDRLLCAIEKEANGIVRLDVVRDDHLDLAGNTGWPEPHVSALEGLLESPRLLLPARSGVELDRMARLAAGLKTPVVLYGAEGGYQVADALAGAKLPVLVSLQWPEKPREADPDAPDSLRTLELRERAPSTPAALLRARVPCAFYTGGVAARDIPRAVRRAIEAGLPEEAAVRAFTLSAAEIYGVADLMGSIAKGRIANLVVTDGPLFGEKSKLKYVFVDGVKFEPVPPEAPGAAAGTSPAGGVR
jgi:hypothetical protein